MSTLFRRTISFVVALLALASVFGSGATPALAAGYTVTVDDDGAQCHSANTSTIQAAVAIASTMPAEANKKIVVCAGTYAEAVEIAGFSNLSVIGKKNAILVPPATPFIDLLSVTVSNNVTIQGLTFDGQMSLSTTAGQYAISIIKSTGKITRNKIIYWHTDSYGANPNIAGIRVNDNGGRTLRIDHNTISNYQDVAILVYGSPVVTITGNTILSASQPYGITLQATGVGSPGGAIISNKLTSSSPIAGSTAIYVLESSGLMINKNTINTWDIGILVEAFCNSASSASANQIISNKVQEVFAGIRLSASAGACDAHTDDNLVKGNSVVNRLTMGTFGIMVYASDAGAGAPVATAMNNLIKSNTIKHFSTPTAAAPVGFADLTGTVFVSNHISP